ncbi:MAG: hypothetical protein JO265_09530 [Acidimicrobiia bacterium]|nr:hypothetical protein [Acidimicrobiia bacterium]
MSEDARAAGGRVPAADEPVVGEPAVGEPVVGESDGGLDQPEDEATEHALRLMDEALRRSDAGRRWLVAGDP